MSGTLFVVATPIGNLEDLTFRSLRTLREADLIAAEDTRRISKLLAHYEVRKPLVSLHEHNEFRTADGLVARLRAGQTIALVSDAGTPTIADPGHHLVAAARNAGIPVVPIPGSCAAAAAISVSGLPGDSFAFLGFPPSGGAARERWFERLAGESTTVVFYESPHRIRRTMEDLTEYVGKRQIFIARELTKANEELVIWHKNDSIREQGEFVVVVGPTATAETPEPEPQAVAVFIGQIIDNTGLTQDEAVPLAAARYGVSEVKVRKLLKKGRILLKRSSDNQKP